MTAPRFIRVCSTGIGFCLLVLLLHSSVPADSDQPVLMRMDVSRQVPLNRKVFGSNLIAYDPSSYEDHGVRTDYFFNDGAGLWDPEARRFNAMAVQALRDAGISSARFPGGCGSHHYDWKKAVGPRNEFLFGIHEFLELCQHIHAQPVITLSYFDRERADLPALVEYLNAEADSEHPWARKRAENGRDSPFGVTFLEFGNEVYHGDHRSVKSVAPKEYALEYLKYRDRLKAKDPDIQLGLVLNIWNDRWNKTVLTTVKDQFDYLVIHLYGYRYFPGDPVLDPGQLFPALFRSPPQYVSRVQKLIQAVPAYTGRDDFRFAVTEYNHGLVQEKPIPYRRTLGAALIMAEMISYLLKEDRLLFADQWHFSGGPWGLVRFERDNKKVNGAIFRPSYDVFQMYHDYAEDYLVNLDITGGSPWLSGIATVSENHSRASLMVANTNISRGLTCSIDLAQIGPVDRADIWTLNGPDVDATNEDLHSRVGISHAQTSFHDRFFTFTFEPHSFTAIQFQKTPP